MGKNQNILKVALHIIGSISFLVFPMIFWRGPFQEEKNIFTNEFYRRDFFIYLLTLIFFYLNYYYLVPRFFLKKRFVFFGIGIVTSFLILFILSNLLMPEVRPKNSDRKEILSNQNPQTLPNDVNTPPPNHRPPGPRHSNSLVFFLQQYFLQFLLASILSILLRLYNQYKLIKEEKVAAELSYLRAQINPHFLFNTLNSIYSMALTKSDNTPTAVVKLSSMMRYALTEAHYQLVPLEQEIEYISDYIDLQKFRLVDTVKLDYKVTGDAQNIKVAPLILISLVENAFKYGVNPEKDSSIKIELNIENQSLSFSVSNIIVNNSIAENEKSGVGIENTKKRISLIYPGKHKLEIKKSENVFIVHLKLDLR